MLKFGLPTNSGLQQNIQDLTSSILVLMPIQMVEAQLQQHSICYLCISLKSSISSGDKIKIRTKLAVAADFAEAVEQL